MGKTVLRHTLFVLLLMAVAPYFAQAQRIYRTEFSVYDTRQDALDANHSRTERYIRFAPKSVEAAGRVEVVAQRLDMPTSWSDYNVYLHIENAIKAYDVVVNGQVVATVEDAYTPADFLLSPYLRQGKNDVSLQLRRSETLALNEGSHSNLVEQFKGSYIFAQYRKHIYDYDVKIVQSGKTLALALDVIVHNDFNYEEPVQIGYDIYAPDGKLIDYAVREIPVAGHSVDTLRIRTSLGEEQRFLWSNAKPQQYRLTLYTQRNGKPSEYHSFMVGAGEATFADGKLLRNGKEVAVKAVTYNARTTREEALADIKALRQQGYNTLTPDTPQPMWFYDICDALGIYVVERANINPTTESANRKVGGTPSNDPALAEEYLSRVKAMYYRTRNHTCIIAYALGGKKAGNGYNMYKTYEWLKSVEKRKAVICPSAEGEWNSDL